MAVACMQGIGAQISCVAIACAMQDMEVPTVDDGALCFKKNYSSAVRYETVEGELQRHQAESLEEVRYLCLTCYVG